MSARSDVRQLEDDAFLDRFEQLVLTQQPASTPWTPVTDYSFEARKAIEGKHPELIRDTFKPKNVLDVGCGREAILVRLLGECGIDATGVDPACECGVSWVPGFSVPGDIVSLDFEHHACDLVICREVLEHLTIWEIRKAVTNLCALSSRFVYVTTRFAKNPTHLLEVDTHDDLDPTHISMLNQTFLRALFVLEGFKRRPDLEAILDWKQAGRVLVYERV